MSNNTNVYWEVNGLSLHTEAWSVRTHGGRRTVPTARRGDDVVVPFRHGRIRTNKFRDSQIISVSMWLVAMNENGTRDATMTMEQKREQNWRKILNAVDVDGTYDLTKRWWEGGVVKAATATAEFSDGLIPTVEGAHRYTFTIEWELSDPFFYSAVAAQPIDGSVDVLGEVETDHVLLTLTNGTNPRVTFPGGNWVQYNGSPGATPVTIDLSTGLAMRGGLYVNGLISRNTAFGAWPTLRPGTQAVTLTGGGTGTLAHDAAYR